jgi:hypothetical protein
MRKLRVGSVVATAMLCIALFLPAHARAQGIPQPCVDSVLPGGALSRYCIPLGWNGQLVVFAHGHVDASQPKAFYHLSLPDGTSLPDLVQSLGFGFATTSYRQNGLAILEGVDDIRELVAQFRTYYTVPLRTYITGVSEGGLVTALLAEQSPELFDAALSTCGPIGNFRAQIDYFGDFRVLFDYFFPGVIPGSLIAVPPAVMANWTTVYVPAIVTALASNPGRALELMRVTKAAFDPANPSTIATTAVNALAYNVFSASDATQKLGGTPFGNRLRWYSGSNNDLRLNLRVARFSASPVAVRAMRAYTTSGDLSIPLVTLHTTGDEVVPFWHEFVYLGKVSPTGRGRFLPLPLVRYGHCNFNAGDVLGAFLLMASQP